MTAPLRPQADDPQVLALTRDALQASNEPGCPPPGLTITCSRCGRVLARAGHTSAGLLFTSTWTTALEATMRVNGRPVLRRQLHAIEVENGYEILEDDEDEDGVESVIALLVLPKTVTQDYPDLLVRCGRHGDLVLDRMEVVARTRTPSRWRVTPIFPRQAVASVSTAWLEGSGESRHTRRVVRFGPRSTPET